MITFIKSIFRGMGYTVGKIIIFIILGLLGFLFFNNKVNASTIPLKWGPVTWNSHSLPYETGIGSNTSTDVTIDFGIHTITENWNNTYNSLAIDVCSTGKITFTRKYSSGSNCNNSCFEQTFYVYDTNISCTVQGYTGYLRRFYLPIKKWDVGSGSDYFLLGDIITVKNNVSWYNAITIAGAYLSNDDYVNIIGEQLYDTALQSSINNLNNAIGNVNSSINSGKNEIINNQNSNANSIINNQNQNQQQTNSKLDNIGDSITDDSLPDTSGISGWASLLPAGPVDSIINMPLTILNSLLGKFNSSCTPVTLPIPLIGGTLTLPCFSSFMSQYFPNFSLVWNLVGGIGSVIILYAYLMNLYKWVDNVLTLRENTNNEWAEL